MSFTPFEIAGSAVIRDTGTIAHSAKAKEKESPIPNLKTQHSLVSYGKICVEPFLLQI
jgi:hypothetical protein